MAKLKEEIRKNIKSGWTDFLGEKVDWERMWKKC